MGKKAKKIRKILRWTLVSVIFLFVILHIPPVQKLITGVITRTVTRRIEGDLDIGRVSYRLWQGKATLEEVEFVAPELRIQVERIDASFFAANGMSLKIIKPWIVLEKQSKRPRRVGSETTPAWMILQQIGNVVVENARFEWKIKNFNGEVEGSLELKRRTIRGLPQDQVWSLIGEVQGQLTDSDPIPIKLTANAGLQAKNLRIDDVHVEAGKSVLSAQGVFSQFSPFAGRMSGGFKIEDSLAKAFPLDIPVQGEASGNFQFEIRDYALTGNVEMESQQLVLADSGPWNLKAKSRIDGKSAILDSFVMSGYQGFIETHGRLDLNRGDVEASVIIQNFDANSLISVWNRLPIALAFLLGAEIQFSLKNWEIDQAQAEGFIQLESVQAEGLPLSGKVGIELNQSVLKIKEAEILSGPGKMVVLGKIPFGGSEENWDLEAKLESFDLSDLLTDFGYNMSADGTLSVKGEAKKPTWLASLQSSLLDKKQTSQEGALSLRAQGQGNEIELEEFKVEMAGGSLLTSCKYQLDTQNITGQMKGEGFRLQELPLLASKMEGLQGNISLNASVQGSLPTPKTRLDMNLDNLLMEETSLPDFSFNLETKGTKAEFKGFATEQFLTGSCLMEDSFPVQLEIDLAALPISEIISEFPKFSQFQILSTKGRFHMDLPLLNPASLSYMGEIESVAGIYATRNWNISSFTITGERDFLLIDGFHLDEGEDFLDINGRVPLKRDDEVDVQLKAVLDLGMISPLLANGELEGQANADFQIFGTGHRIRAQGDATISQCRGKWEDVSWENLELQLTGSENGFRLNTLSMSLHEGSLSANGHVFWTDTGLDSNFSFQLDQINMGSMLAGRGKSQTQAIRVSGGGEVTASELSLPGITGAGSFTSIDAKLGGAAVSLQNPAEWRIEAGKISLLPTRFTGDDTDFSIAFEYDTQQTPPEWDLSVDGTINPAFANPLISDNNIRLSGETKINIDLKSQAGQYSGQALVEGGQIRLRDPAVSVSNLQVEASFQEQFITITKMRGEVGQGSVEISGRIVPDESGKLREVDLRINAEDIALNLAEGIYSRMSGEMQLLGEAPEIVLSGTVILPRIFFQQELDTGSDSLVHLDRQIKNLEKEPSLLEYISLDLGAEIQDLQVKNSLAQLSAEGNLTIKGNLSTPRLDGSIQLKSGGSIRIGRADVRIDEGRVVFDNYPDVPLEIALNGISRLRGIPIELSVKGRMDDLQTQISAPTRSDLTQGDLAMLFMTGRTTETAVSEAGTIVTEQLAANLGGMLQQQVGEKVYIDISSDQTEFNYEADPTTRFSLGHQVAPNLYVIYSTALNGTKTRGILDFRPPQPFRLRYIYEEDGRSIIAASHTLGFWLRSQQNPKKRGIEDQSRIHDLVFEGESPLEQKELRKLSRLKPGKRYKYWEALQAAERIRKKLVKLGYRGAMVEVEDSPASAGEVDVIIRMETGKRINLVWVGDDLNRGSRKKIEALWDGYSDEDELAEILARQARFSLQAGKYYLARVTPSLSQSETEITVQFDVAKGLKGQSVSLQFEGNDILPDDKLAAALPKSTTSSFFEVIDEESNVLRRTIHVLYASEGFLRGEVEDVRTVYADADQKLIVTLSVNEGPRSRVASLNLPQEAAEISGPDAPVFSLKEDLPFRIEDYVNDRSVLTTFYREQGFFQPRVSGVLKPVDGKIAVYFSVEKGPPARVGEIRAARLGRTRLSTIKKIITLKEGDPILPIELAISRKRLFDTRAFQSVDIQAVSSDAGPEIRDLVIDLIEKPEVQVNYGVRYTLNDPSLNADESSGNYKPFEIGGGLMFLNPFGFGDRYGASGYFFGQDQFYRFFYETESFFGLRFPTQVFLSQDWLRDLQVSGFRSRINRITFQQYHLWGEGREGNLWGEKLRLQWNYSFRHIRLTPLDETRPILETDRGSISLALIGDTRDNFVNTKKGFFWSLSYEFARKWLGSDVNFIKLYGQAFLHIPLGEKITWASGLRLGAVPGENPFLIIEDRFFAGGVYSIRGFPQFYLGPKNELGEPLGGQAVVIFNQELRFPLYRSFHGGIFYDAGNVFALVQQMSLKGLRHSAGLGLRYMLPFGPIRFDWAYVLDPKPGEKRYRFMFTIGHVF